MPTAGGLARHARPCRRSRGGGPHGMIRFPGPAFEERESIAPGDQLKIGETGVGVRAVGGTPAKERPEAIDLPGERSGRQVKADTESDAPSNPGSMTAPARVCRGCPAHACGCRRHPEAKARQADDLEKTRRPYESRRPLQVVLNEPRDEGRGESHAPEMGTKRDPPERTGERKVRARSRRTKAGRWRGRGNAAVFIADAGYGVRRGRCRGRGGESWVGARRRYARATRPRGSRAR